MVQPLLKTVLQFLEKLDIYLPSGPAGTDYKFLNVTGKGHQNSSRWPQRVRLRSVERIYNTKCQGLVPWEQQCPLKHSTPFLTAPQSPGKKTWLVASPFHRLGHWGQEKSHDSSHTRRQSQGTVKRSSLFPLSLFEWCLGSGGSVGKQETVESPRPLLVSPPLTNWVTLG